MWDRAVVLAGNRRDRLLITLLLAFAVLWIAAPRAGAASLPGWSTKAAPGNQAIALSISCGAPDNCMGVFNEGNGDGSAETLHYTNGAWHATKLASSAPGWVSCSSASHCVEIVTSGSSGSSESYTYADGRWDAGTPAGMVPDPYATAAGPLSCPTTTFCAYAGGTGAIFLEHGDGWVSGTVAPDTTELNTVSCSSAKSCTAAGIDSVTQQAVAYHYDGRGWSKVSVQQPSGTSGSQITGISCTGAQSCAAIGYATGSDQHAAIWSQDGGTFKVVGQPDTYSYSSVAEGVSCASTNYCIASTYSYKVANGSVTEVGSDDVDIDGSWSEASHTPAAGAVSCVTSTFCMLGAVTSETYNADAGGLGTPGDTYLQSSPYVAVGDSFSAGDGAIPDGKYEKYPNACHVTPQAYPKLIASALALKLDDFACTGTAIEGRNSNPMKIVRNQIAKIPADAGLVTLTIGGNATPIFADVTLCNVQLIRLIAGCASRYRAAYEASVAALPQRLEAVYREIHAQAPMARLVVLEYPSAIPPHPDAKCDDLLADYVDEGHVVQPYVKLLKQDMPFFRSAMDTLNAAVSRAVAASSIPETDGSTWKPQLIAMTGSSVPDDFDQHSLCSASPWEWPLRAGTVPVESSLHPNIPGNKAMAANAIAAMDAPDATG